MARKKKNSNDPDRRKKLLAILLTLLAILILVSLITHTVWDDNRIRAFDNPFDIDFRNQVGIIGAFTSYILISLMGWLAFFLPFLLIIPALKLTEISNRTHINRAIWVPFSLSVLITMLANLFIGRTTALGIEMEQSSGGYLLYYLTKFVIRVIGNTGAYILIGAGIITILVVVGYMYPFLRKQIIRKPESGWKVITRPLTAMFGFLYNVLWGLFKKSAGDIDYDPEYESETVEREEQDVDNAVSTDSDDLPSESSSHKGRKKKEGRKKLEIKKQESPVGRTIENYTFPGLELLNYNPDSGPSVSPDELEFTARALKDTLETFHVKIEGEIEKFPGPVITRFEFKPAAGIKVNQILNLSDDLALALQAKRIRIVAPIPGKAAVGVEIPNRKAQLVYIKDIVASELFANSRLKLPLALGRSISGRPYVTDLAKMPHLLVAGATGAGKSVCINSMITSLLYRLHPDELKFIFIDPKMLELSVYAGLPHLGRPVVTNSKRAEKVLSDAVIEMEKRYKTLAGQSVRSIHEYNARLKKSEEKMPYIVIIVDELADMMMASTSTRIEMLITRLAQMARAVGIHLILATQRPSVDVITGLIKANFSARIAFQVATKIDSRTIIDGNGAEKLLGNGDMLFLQPGQPESIRLHGAFISGEETEKIVSFIKDQFPKEEAAVTGEGGGGEMEDKTENIDLDDPLFIEAAQTVIRHKQGSVSLLQRKLGIGYQRAARLIDNLEEAGIVGKYDGSKAREVMVDTSYLEELLASRSLTRPNSHL